MLYILSAKVPQQPICLLSDAWDTRNIITQCNVMSTKMLLGTAWVTIYLQHIHSVNNDTHISFFGLFRSLDISPIKVPRDCSAILTTCIFALNFRPQFKV